MARKKTLLLTLLSLLICGGCMLPVYYEPGGYSSTWQKRMRESRVEWPKPVKGSEWSIEDWRLKTGDWLPLQSSSGDRNRQSNILPCFKYPETTE